MLKSSKYKYLIADDIIKAVLYCTAGIISIYLIKEIYSISEMQMLYMSLSVGAFSFFSLVKMGNLKGFYTRNRVSVRRKNILIVGDGKAGKLLCEKLMDTDFSGLNIIGFADDKQPIGYEIARGKEVLGSTQAIKEITDEYDVDEILITEDVSYSKLLKVLDLCRNLNVRITLSSGLFDIVMKKTSPFKYAGIPVVDLSRVNNSDFNLRMKRIIDIIISAIGLVLLSPLFLLLAILIKTSSKGPVFFKQIRIGKDGKPFDFYKFRSMTVVDGEDEERKKMMIEFMKKNRTNGADTKVINESRVTWIGKIIRKTSIDELPQLYNVLKGDMSLVGPRPCLPYEYENYEEWQKQRVKVLPGCTGLWQVSGRSSVSFVDSIVLDLYYINKMTPWFDLKLISKTIPVMFLSRGGK